ncbi:recombinase family protein [Cytophagaceae bacterium DM2B3-1]|uniref:Recombinase family protein n=1 Tax=Xanthocytophaga flava TaxID=3048013 RepID=A0ABT7CWV5_9BACT|nr:recombinase family protein [Xanthocytophaga flavus]MDJ1498253.1 recombinase family protein [Xanthocytophaga flavus]
MKKFVAYYRVSTIKQGQSGLGLEAQRAAVSQFVKDNMLIKGEFIEVESGKRNDRIQLREAIAFAKDKSATLIIAKLDRLSRNAGFIFALRDSGVDFICADMPDANTLTVGIFAVLAQHERELISQRTKAALQAKKEKGFLLGKPENLTREAGEKGRASYKKIAAENENNRRATALILSLRASGMKWLHIANTLNQTGFKTSKGKPFQAVQVQRLYQRSLQSR